MLTLPVSTSITYIVASSELFSDRLYARRLPSHETLQSCRDELPSADHVLGSISRCSAPALPVRKYRTDFSCVPVRRM